MKRSACLAVMLTLSIALLCACGVLSDAAELQSYDFGKDAVPSVKAVLGQTREVSGVTTGTDNGTQYKEYKYTSVTAHDDLVAYMEHMVNNEAWMLTKDLNLSNVPGSTQIAKASADEGNILILDISYDQGSYTFLVKKGKGSLTPK